jgi:lambda family phage portal protein
MAKRAGFFRKLADGALAAMGLQKIKANSGASFAGAASSRLNADWASSIYSPDLELRNSLKMMRYRSRQLAKDNDYARRFISLVQQNVIGPRGIAMRSDIDESELAGAEQVNAQIDKGWQKFCESAITACGQMSAVDFANLCLESLITDGEIFIRRLKGFGNDDRYAVELIDPDRVPVELNLRREVRLDGTVVNEIRMGVEVDEWRRPVSYRVLTQHPTEGGTKYEVIPAWQIEHVYLFRRIGQTRGIPFMHAAMSDMHMLGKYEEAELVAARVAACKMAAITSKTGDEFAGQHDDKKHGAVEIDVQEGSMFELPEGMSITPIDWQHPNAAFPEFVKAMLRGMAVGLNVSYASLAGDLREVNYSSIRQGALDERDAWRALQTFATRHIYMPILTDWFAMAQLIGRLKLPAAPAGDRDFYLDRVNWKPRGWFWVDPYKEAMAHTYSVRACFETLDDVCSEKGVDWRDNIRQRARENKFAKDMGVTIDLGGAGISQPDESGADNEGTTGSDSSQPAKPAAAPKKKQALALTEVVQ